MRFLYLDVLVARAHAGMAVFEPLELACPRCRMRYFLDGEPPADPRAHEDLKNRAVARLNEECPDYLHHFEVVYGHAVLVHRHS